MKYCFTKDPKACEFFYETPWGALESGCGKILVVRDAQRGTREIDATKLLLQAARKFALSVSGFLNASEVDVPRSIKEFLKTGNEELREAVADEIEKAIEAIDNELKPCSGWYKPAPLVAALAALEAAANVACFSDANAEVTYRAAREASFISSLDLHDDCFCNWDAPEKKQKKQKKYFNKLVEEAIAQV